MSRPSNCLRGPDMNQLSLFPEVAEVFMNAPGPVSNKRLYAAVAEATGLDPVELEAVTPVGKAGAPRSLVKREIRWHQQTLKQLGVIERVDHGVWQLSEKIRSREGDLTRVLPDIRLVAFSTDLGVAIWGRAESVFPGLGEKIQLCISSPPYPLKNPRPYGNPPAEEYTDFICRSLEPIVRNLEDSGSVVLNISNDIFEDGSPARSLYVERLLIALHDRLGLHLMERVPWVNKSKPPGPTYWACRKRVLLSACFEPIYWLAPCPGKVKSDNRHVLEPHSPQHLALMAAGGAGRTAQYGNGAYRLRPHSFGRLTEGKIPRNVLERGHRCADTLAYRKAAQEAGLPLNGAMFPSSVPEFFIKLLTDPGDLVVDLFGGTARSGLVAERLKRRWLVTEWIREYLAGGAFLFRGFPGFEYGAALK